MHGNLNKQKILAYLLIKYMHKGYSEHATSIELHVTNFFHDEILHRVSLLLILVLALLLGDVLAVSRSSCRTTAEWTSTRTDRRSPWAAPCNPWCSCIS